MTTYRDRHLAGEYTLGNINTKSDAAPEAEPEQARAVDAGAAPRLDEMTKAELLEFAQQLGVSPANNDMTKQEIRAGIDAHLA